MSEFDDIITSILLYGDKEYLQHNYHQPICQFLHEIDESLLYYGNIQSSYIPILLELLKSGIQDGNQTDEDLLIAFTYSDYMLLKFLLYIIIQKVPEYTSIAIRCIALLGNIHPTLWILFLTSIDNPIMSIIHLQWVITLIDIIPTHISEIRKVIHHIIQLQHHNLPYHGYDSRDQQEYLLSGYEDYQDNEKKHQQQKEESMELIMIYLLFITQIFHFPIEIFQQTIVMNRKTMSISSSSNNQLLLTCSEQDQKLTQFHFIDECIHCIEELIAICYDDDITNDSIYQYCFEGIIFINQQFLIDIEAYHQSTEIVDCIVHMDRHSQQSGKLIQGIISILNEHGYPNMSSMELTMATMYTCINIFYSTVMSDSIGQEDETEDTQAIDITTGNYYTNDIKVRYSLYCVVGCLTLCCCFL